MESERSDLWYVPFPDDSVADHQILEHPSDISTYSAVSSPHISEFDFRASTFYRHSHSMSRDDDMPLSPTEILMDEIWTPSRRDSSGSITPNGDKTQTSSKRRAQNRAAQRAFRERKEKRTKDLEEQLTDMTEKYKELAREHNQLQESYDKLQQTLELLTCDDAGRTSGEQLRRFLDILQGKARSRVKHEA